MPSLCMLVRRCSWWFSWFLWRMLFWWEERMVVKYSHFRVATFWSKPERLDHFAETPHCILWNYSSDSDSGAGFFMLSAQPISFYRHFSAKCSCTRALVWSEDNSTSSQVLQARQNKSLIHSSCPNGTCMIAVMPRLSSSCTSTSH